jgi:hypothetical protein
MGAITLIAIGCIWAIGKYPQSWKEILPVGGGMELALLITAFLRGKETTK